MTCHMCVLTDPQCNDALLLLLLHISLISYKFCCQVDLYSICYEADRGSFSGPDCCFSSNLLVYVLKAGNKHHLHWCVLKLDVLQCVSITLSMRTHVCTDTRKLQYVFDRQCCTAYQHMQTGKARASGTCNSCLVS